MQLSKDAPSFANWKEHKGQNIPSGSKYGKMVKEIFIPPENMLFCGIDYAALNFGGLS